MQNSFPERRLYRIASSPVALALGLTLLGLSLITKPNLYLLAAPGFLLCGLWVLLTMHPRPRCGWVPKHTTTSALSTARSVAVSAGLVLTGRMCIGHAAAPIALSKTLSIRNQSSTFLLATAAALTCDCHADADMAAAIHQGLATLGVDPAKMQKQWRLISFDTPQNTFGATVQDGSGTRCFFMGDPLTLILSCGRLTMGETRAMETEDRTALLHTLDAMRASGGTVIAYAMLDTPEQPLAQAAFLGMISLVSELRPGAAEALQMLSRYADVFCDLPDGVLSGEAARVIRPVAQCSDTPLRISCRPHRKACLLPTDHNPDAEGWAEGFLLWQQWSRRLLGRLQCCMILLPFLAWLLLSGMIPGQHLLMAPILPAVISLCFVQPPVLVTPSKRWLMLWPTLTLVFAFFVSIPFPGGAQWLFAPGMMFTSAAACAMSLILPMFCNEEQRKRLVWLLSSAAILCTGVCCALIWHACPAALLTAVLGAVWGVCTMLVLRQRLAMRL